MGTYNPAAPQDLGMEWVGIRDENLEFSPAVNALELGYGFTLATARQVGDGRFYINDWPPGAAAGQVYMVSVYPQGQEDNSGPVRRVVIPCNSGGITGGNMNFYGTATTLAEAFEDPSDSSGLSLAATFGGGSNYFRAFFATSQYQNELSGKRILGVNLLYALAGEIEDVELDFILTLDDSTNHSVLYGSTENGTLYGNSTAASALTSATPTQISRMPMGEINPLWSTASGANTTERQPWNYTGLARMEASSANRISIRGDIGTASSASFSFFITLEYMALEILYCEEQRVAVGARSFGYSASNPTRHRPYVMGVNTVPMRNISQVANPVLPAASYTAVLSSADQGTFQPVSDVLAGATKTPVLNALRELYAIPPHPGIQINLPFPKTPNIVGRVFTSEVSHVIPHMSLHATGGSVLTEIHPYGRQIAAPVYGSIVARQGVINAAYGATPTNYPQVRFWARRFGDTTVALNLHNQSGLPAQSASITVADFDALPEILDGWKEVNLTFTGPTPSFTAAGTATTYEWSASGENIGNRWEILGATSLAISGIPGNLIQTVPSGQVLDAATYGGTTAFAGWLQPNGSAVASDTTSDISIIFAQNMPTVANLALTTASQSVSGIGMSCADPRAVAPVINANSDFNASTGWTAFNGATLAYDPTWSYSPYQSAKVTPDGVGVTPLILSDDFSVAGGTSYTAAAWLYSAAGNANTGIGFNWFEADGNYITSDTYFQGIVAGKWTLIQSAFTTPANAAIGSMYVLEGSTPAASAVFWVDEATIRLTTPESASGGLNIPPACIPTGISFHRVTWTSYATQYGASSAPVTGFGYYELQRMDTIDTDWQTIMQATDVGRTSFLDYEPRVGVQSSYRIRGCDAYEFCGPWSSTVSSTLLAPGIAGTDGNGVLIFTSNERQDGSINLAYTEQWNSTPETQFDFPEAGNVKLQEWYNHDFVTAFRPLERGGERFEAVLLVQAAAVSAPVLEGVFNSLRDMAWDTVQYICVRNELGDRWWATVLVPDGRVRRNRRLQLARVQVIEVSDTPCVAEPDA